MSESFTEVEETLQEFLNQITSILDFDTNKDIRSFLKRFLQRSKTLLQCDYLCIYHIKSAKLDLFKLAAIELKTTFPQRIPLEDLLTPYTPDLWTNNHIAGNELQRFAQDSGLNYLSTYPLGQGQEFIGLLVVGGFENQVDRLHLKKLQIISSIIESALQKQILRDALHNRNELQYRIFESRNLLFNNTKEGILIVDPSLKVIELNAAAEQMLGYSLKEVFHQPVSDVLIGADGLMDALEVAGAGIETRELGIASVHKRNGQVFSAHIQTFPLLNQKEKPWSILILISDESENEQNRIRAQHLEQRAALGGLSAIFAHEVRNPINNIYTAVQLLKVRILPDDPNYEVLSRMQSDCTRLITLMESVLAFSRPIEAKLQSVNICNQIDNILERWRPRFDRLNIHSILKKPNQDVFVLGDMRLIEQIFTNLISNAVDVMEHIGGSLAVKITRNEFIVAQPQIEITVSDTGPGIPDDIIEKIFDPFVSTKPKGTGLGLAITKHMVTAQQGTIRVRSFPGGSVFYVNLPEFQENAH